MYVVLYLLLVTCYLYLVSHSTQNFPGSPLLLLLAMIEVVEKGSSINGMVAYLVSGMILINRASRGEAPSSVTF